MNTLLNLSTPDPLEDVIDQTWHDLGECIPRARVCEVTHEVAAAFQNASITTFVPLFVRRKTRQRLESEIRQTS